MARGVFFWRSLVCCGHWCEGRRNLTHSMPDVGEHIYHSSIWPVRSEGWGGPIASFVILWFQGQLELQKTLSLKKKSLQTKPKREEDSPVSMCRGFITGVWKEDHPGAAGERRLPLPLFYIEKLRGREGNCLVQAIQNWDRNRSQKCPYLIPFSFCSGALRGTKLLRSQKPWVSKNEWRYQYKYCTQYSIIMTDNSLKKHGLKNQILNRISPG